MLKIIIGGLAGALIGYFVMYKLIGCASGACPITRSPYISTIYGSIIGMVMGSTF